MTEDELVGWHHQLNGCEFEPTRGGGEAQESLACFCPCDLAAAAAAVTKLCPHLCNTVSCSTVGFPVLPYLLEFAQTHIH